MAEKSKKKHWVPILAPPLFDSQSIGKTLSHVPEDTIGRSICVNVMNLTRDMKKQSQLVTMRIGSVKDNTAHTELYSFSVMPSAIKRLVRRNRDRIDMSFLAVTKDEIKVRIKVILVTRTLTSQAKRTDLNHAAEKEIKLFLKQQSFEHCIRLLIQGKFQSTIRNAIKNIYPLRSLEIKTLQRHIVTEEA